MSPIIPSDTKFITAIIHWLSLFPDSPILFNDSFNCLYEPMQIVKILKLVMDDSFDLGVELEEVQGQEEEGDKEDLENDRSSMMTQRYKLIFQKVLSYYKDNMKSRKKICKYLDMIRFEDFDIVSKMLKSGYMSGSGYPDVTLRQLGLCSPTDEAGAHRLTRPLSKGTAASQSGLAEFLRDSPTKINLDYNLNILCCIFFEIGLHSYRSSICMSLMWMLSDEDQRELTCYINDEQELKNKCLLMEERLKLLQLENVAMKKSFSETENELKRTRKKVKSLESEVDLISADCAKVLEAKESEIQLLKQEMKKYRQQAKSKDQEIQQLNDDFKTLNISLNGPNASNALSSPSKKRLKRLAQSALANAPVTTEEYPYDMLLFDYKLVGEVLRDYVLKASVASQRRQY
ncbi:hypothetical protein WICPIJ_002267 [Wickerhamomyces pijperi]|uniref:Uncharacterized protein n=1 Tax=Wickerhamomyces pijperi TaxID=599730 RepID=A0A9P8QBS3_WICPI|nr:hypothetical protein WICPIJ_002267 [Wickerhamomyces pijperi]